jgi:hypothetical protein
MKHELKGLLWSIAVSIALAVLIIVLAGCGYAKRKDPALFFESSPAAQTIAAQLRAREVNGYAAGPIGATNFMVPTIRAGDWLVVAPTPFTDDLLGRICIYAPKWHPRGTVAHRFAAGNAIGGFIPSGDNNARSEPFEPITATAYRGEVIAIYRLAPP